MADPCSPQPTPNPGRSVRTSGDTSVVTPPPPEHVGLPSRVEPGPSGRAGRYLLRLTSRKTGIASAPLAGGGPSSRKARRIGREVTPTKPSTLALMRPLFTTAIPATLDPVAACST